MDMEQSPPMRAILATWVSNLKNRSHEAVSNLRLRDYVHLLTIIGAYLLFRPYLIKLGANLQARQHERDSEQSKREQNGSMDPNELRGNTKIALPGVDSDESEDDEKHISDLGWGNKARRKQREFIRAKLEEHERRILEQTQAESDKDIEEFLLD
jgi:hypothetical protein